MKLRTALLQLALCLPFLMHAQNENKITSKFDFIPGEKVILKTSVIFRYSGIPTAAVKLSR